jgi:ketol-acid reductoisomerase
LLATGQKHPVEKVGQKLRSLMPWIPKKNIKGAQAAY